MTKEHLPSDAKLASKNKIERLMKIAEGMTKKQAVNVSMNKAQLKRYAQWLMDTNCGAGKPTEYKAQYSLDIVKFFQDRCKEPYRVEEFIVYDKSGSALTDNAGQPLKDKRMIANNPPYLIDFATEVGVLYTTLMKWAKAHVEFGDAMMHARELRTKFIVDNGLQNLYNPQSWIYATKNLSGWTDRTDVTSKDESIFNVKLQRFDNPDEADNIKAQEIVVSDPPMLR